MNTEPVEEKAEPSDDKADVVDQEMGGKLDITAP